MYLSKKETEKPVRVTPHTLMFRRRQAAIYHLGLLPLPATDSDVPVVALISCRAYRTVDGYYTPRACQAYDLSFVDKRLVLVAHTEHKMVEGSRDRTFWAPPSGATSVTLLGYAEAEAIFNTAGARTGRFSSR
jgi:hypothetical protein